MKYLVPLFMLFPSFADAEVYDCDGKLTNTPYGCKDRSKLVLERKVEVLGSSELKDRIKFSYNLSERKRDWYNRHGANCSVGPEGLSALCKLVSLSGRGNSVNFRYSNCANCAATSVKLFVNENQDISEQKTYQLDVERSITTGKAIIDGKELRSGKVGCTCNFILNGTINDLPPGNYKLNFSFMNYGKQERSIYSTNFFRISGRKEEIQFIMTESDRISGS